MMWWLFPVMIVCLHIHIISSVNLEDFYIAARTGDVETISTMLSTGIITNVHKRDSKGNTAFIVAAGRGQTGVLQYLLSQGAQIEDSTKGGLLGGKTALCWSASQGRELAVSFLLEAGANPNHATEDGVFLGKTPLMWASSQGKAGVVQILINSGADIDYASQGGNFKGKTSLMWASSQGRVEATLRLLEAGASVDLVDVDGVSALMWATGSEGDNDGSHNKGLFEKALKGHNDVVKTLLLYGATIDTRDKDGITALMYAAFHGHVDAVQTLINAGADMSVKNNAGKTALYLADSSGHANVVQVLRQGPNIHVYTYYLLPYLYQ
jgi:ankyrin repeat protein